MWEGREFYVVMYDTFAMVGVVFHQGIRIIEETIKRMPVWDGEVPRSVDYGSAEKLKEVHPWLDDDLLRYAVKMPARAQQVFLEVVDG